MGETACATKSTEDIEQQNGERGAVQPGGCCIDERMGALVAVAQHKHKGHLHDPDLSCPSCMRP